MSGAIRVRTGSLICDIKEESNSDGVTRSVLPSLLGNGHPHPHRNDLLAAVDACPVAFGAHAVKDDDVAGAEREVWMGKSWQ